MFELRTRYHHDYSHKSLEPSWKGTSNPPLEGVDPIELLEAFIQHIDRVINSINNLGAHNNNHNGEQQWQTGDKLLERFRALRPEKFDGMFEG